MQGYSPTSWNGSALLPPAVTIPEPLVPVLQAGVAEFGLTVQETAALDAGTPIFQTLVQEAVQRQIQHEEDQLRAWLAAIINNPAGRRIIEEML